jgi:hypothetical protein
MSIHVYDEDERNGSNNHSGKCDSCVRRYSAADIAKFKYLTKQTKPATELNETNDDAVTCAKQSMNKKLSNLKKAAKSSSTSYRPKQSEKVKFSNIEMRHVINMDGTSSNNSCGNVAKAVDLDNLSTQSNLSANQVWVRKKLLNLVVKFVIILP